MTNVTIIPVSATEGDNVTTKSDNMPWYKGEALLSHLETVDIKEDTEKGFYMPVQRVCRPNHEFRGFQGQIENGAIRAGDLVTTLPSKEEAHVKSILVGDKEVQEAVQGQPVTIQLDREVDVSRGCVLTIDSGAVLTDSVEADILWMDGEMQKAAELYLQVKNKTTNGIVWMEMDRFFRGYKSEILKSCEELIANHNKKEALALMELWSRLIPEDDDIQGALYLAKTVCARTQSEIEKEIGEIRAVIGTQMITPVSVEKNPGKSRKQIKSDRTSDETSADDVNKKYQIRQQKLKKLKRRRIYRLKFQKNIRCTGKLLQEHGSGWGIPMSLQNCAPRSSVQVRRANWSGLQNRYETVSFAEKRKPALISWWVMSG